jgi:hypothetical protein
MCQCCRQHKLLFSLLLQVVLVYKISSDHKTLAYSQGLQV